MRIHLKAKARSMVVIASLALLLVIGPCLALAHFRLGESFLEDHNFHAAANEFRSALDGDASELDRCVDAH